MLARKYKILSNDNKWDYKSEPWNASESNL